DCLAWGLPREGQLVRVPTVGEVARRDVETCGLTDRVADAKARAHAAGFAACVVVNERRVVLGLLRSRELDADPAATAERVMRAGPTTYRPNVPAREAGARMRERRVDTLLVTTPDGTLVGLLRREDAEDAEDAAAGGDQRRQLGETPDAKAEVTMRGWTGGPFCEETDHDRSGPGLRGPGENIGAVVDDERLAGQDADIGDEAHIVLRPLFEGVEQIGLIEPCKATAHAHPVQTVS